MLLSVIAAEFSLTMRAEGGSVRNFRDEAAAYYLAKAGIEMGIAEIAADYNIVSRNEDGIVAFMKSEGGVFKPLESQRSFGLGGGRVEYTINDESGKLNLNIAARQEIEELLRIAGIEKVERDTIADSVLDWRDENHEFHLNGAEDDYYRSLPKPYEAKDGLFDSIEELLMVRGMSPLIFFGNKIPPEFGLQKVEDEHKGIARFVTVKGDGKININTAEEEVLEAALGRAKAQEVLLRRNTEGYFEKPAYGGVPSSNIFSITSVGEVNGFQVRLKAIAERKPALPKVRITYWNENPLLY
ncbi:MAG: general secretion pathway protein GspK [Deltaproteobacteria bacterium]|nr:general secretion pathway protein GspK [Deltaproteobacteria bacterium]